jgi:putative transposase
MFSSVLACLMLRTPKCRFAQSEVHYLGHIVSREGVQTDHEKTRAVTKYPAPKDVKQLKQFLGLTN